MAITVTVSAGDTSNVIKIYNYPVNESGLQNYKIHEQPIITTGYHTISVDFTYAGTLEIHFFAHALQFTWQIDSILTKPL